MNELLLCGTIAVVLSIVVIVAFLLRDSGGLSSEHHSELNKMLGKGSSRYDELRDEYAGDSVAQQQIDKYDGGTEYHGRLRAYADALESSDSSGKRREEQWFENNYPDV